MAAMLCVTRAQAAEPETTTDGECWVVRDGPAHGEGHVAGCPHPPGHGLTRHDGVPEGSIRLVTPVARPGHVARLIDGVWWDCPGAGLKPSHASTSS